MPIYKDENKKDNPWYYSFEIKDENGKWKTIRKRGFRTKKDAEKAEISIKDAMNKGTYVQQSKLSFSEYLNNWLANRRDIKDKTKVGYKVIIEQHIAPLIGRIPLSEVNAMTIESFLTKIEEKNFSESYVRNIFKVLNKSLKDAERKQLIIRNPAALVAKPRVSKKEMLCWTPEESKQFLKAIFDHRLRIIFVLAIHSGMRMGEILGLRFCDVDLTNMKINIRNILNFKNQLQAGTKTNAGNRSISISDFVVKQLEIRRQNMLKEKAAAGDDYDDKDFVVSTKYGTPYSKAMCDAVWRRLLKKSKLKRIRFHDLRHTCASLLLSLEIHPKVVQELLGHSSIQITLDLYSHLTPNMNKDAAYAMERLLDLDDEDVQTEPESEY
ncbi:Site-specific recombinase XerD [Paenibacillus sp. 1_12]|uniref:site-specific integrase n=1 Tax=Paenibacillus sp. 1_12 TaxID=1566278 RepID=UPI0008E511A2|nr:site-specific integrase [Paenibacillus sp. 1_12]SFK76293.1 Site-specific recombinase XerD [Paenibacillus sp. 1_12]